MIWLKSRRVNFVITFVLQKFAHLCSEQEGNTLPCKNKKSDKKLLFRPRFWLRKKRPLSSTIVTYLILFHNTTCVADLRVLGNSHTVFAHVRRVALCRDSKRCRSVHCVGAHTASASGVLVAAVLKSTPCRSLWQHLSIDGRLFVRCTKCTCEWKGDIGRGRKPRGRAFC